MSYTVLIKKRFGWERICLVEEHATTCTVKDVPIRPRLVLRLVDGSRRIVSKIDERDWILGADYIRHMAKLKADEEARKAEEENGLPNAASIGSDGGL